MPNPRTEAACTAAVDLPDVRCLSPRHPHRGSHHATRKLTDGTFVTVFWTTPDNAPAHDGPQPATASLPITEADPQPVPPRLPARLRRTDYTSGLLAL